jgi:hypothetical protein
MGGKKRKKENVRKRDESFHFLATCRGEGRKANKTRGEEEGVSSQKFFVSTKQLSCAEPCST